MKIKSFMLMSFTAALCAACSSGSDNEDVALPENKVDVSFVASMPEVGEGTRTSFDVNYPAAGKPSYTPLWTRSEKLSVLYGDNISASYTAQNASYSESAEFNFDGTDNPIKTGNTIVAINKPLSLHGGSIATRGIQIGGGEEKEMADSYSAAKLLTPFKSEQEIQGTSRQKFDEGSEILVSAPVKLEATTSYPVILDFKRYNGIVCLKIVPNGDKQYPLGTAQIKEITLTTGSDADNFGGDVEINTTEQKLTKLNGKKVSVKGNGGSAIGNVGIDNPLYISVLPTVINSGSNFKIYFKTTDGRTYERILNAPPKGVNVAEAVVTTFQVGFGDKHLKVRLPKK